MKLANVTTGSVRKISNKELLSLHWRMHQLYTVAKKRGNKKLVILLKEKHKILVDEMKRRGIKHQSSLTLSMRLVEDNKYEKKTQFIVHDHDAFRAGKHQDLRFKIKSNKWDSFAVPKKVPLKLGVKVLAIKTHSHSNKEAMFVGEIPKGEYGGGKLKVFDQGDCIIEKYTPAHIVIDFKGRKIKGIYHLINIGVTGKARYKQQQYLLFKGKISGRG